MLTNAQATVKSERVALWETKANNENFECIFKKMILNF